MVTVSEPDVGARRRLMLRWLILLILLSGCQTLEIRDHQGNWRPMGAPVTVEYQEPDLGKSWVYIPIYGLWVPEEPCEQP